VLLLQASQWPSGHAIHWPRRKVYVKISRGEAPELQAPCLARTPAPGGPCRVELDLTRWGLRQQLKRADRSGASWALLIGEGEI